MQVKLLECDFSRDLWKHVPNFPDFINAVILCTQRCLSFIPCSADKLDLLFKITFLKDFMKTWPTDVNIGEYSGTALKKNLLHSEVKLWRFTCQQSIPKKTLESNHLLALDKFDGKSV